MTNKKYSMAGAQKAALLFLTYLIFQTPLLAFEKEGAAPASASKDAPENVIIVVIDGPRYSETWGEPDYKYMPKMGKKLRKKGTLFTHFYNTGVTSTNPGHTAIATGVNQPIDNMGKEIPQFPSIFQHWLQATQKPASSAWLITSKGKLNVLANAQHPDWTGKYAPSMSCGIDGKGNGYRTDAETMEQVRNVLAADKPNVVFINFKEPDSSGHGKRWDDYLQGIRDTDAYVAEIWDIIQKSKHYKDNTVLLVTNDHGRHLDGHKDGYVSHGDACAGCRHISLFAIGKNVEKKKQVSTHYDQTDIAVTVARLLGFEMPYAKGKVITELVPGSNQVVEHPKQVLTP